MIAGAGCDVVEAGDADEATAILEVRSDIEVIFTDIRMPGSMDGLRLAKYVSGRWPPIKIIATSGYFAIARWRLAVGWRLPAKALHPRRRYQGAAGFERQRGLDGRDEGFARNTLTGAQPRTFNERRHFRLRFHAPDFTKTGRTPWMITAARTARNS
jgi:CheY-like chemotaxis protein